MRRRHYLGGLSAGIGALVSTASAARRDGRARGARAGGSDGISVSIADVNDPVRAGDVLRTDVSVENTADHERSQELHLVVADEVVDTETLTVPGGEHWPVLVPLSYETYPVERDVEFPVTVACADDSDDRTVEVVTEADGDLSVDISSVNDPVDAGDLLRARATIENTGSVSKTQTIRLVVGGEVVDTETLTVPNDEVYDIPLSYETYPVRQDVTFSVTVECEDDADRRTVSVNGTG